MRVYELTGVADICSHPLCLLSTLGHDIDPDDTSAMRARLEARGFTGAQCNDIASELRWAWIEQGVALARYVSEGVWEGSVCELHGLSELNAGITLAARSDDEKDSLRELCREIGALSTGSAPSTVSIEDFDDDERLTELRRCQLAIAAERVTLGVQMDSGYRSEAEDGEDDVDEIQELRQLQLNHIDGEATSERTPASLPPILQQKNHRQEGVDGRWKNAATAG